MTVPYKKKTTLQQASNFWDPSELVHDSNVLPNDLTNLMNGKALTTSELTNMLSSPLPQVIQKKYWHKNDNQDNFWRLLLEKSSEEIINLLSPSVQVEEYPNVAAWCLSLKTPYAIELTLKTHKNNNIYATEKFHILKEALEHTSVIHECPEPGIAYEKTLLVLQPLIDAGLLNTTHLNYLKSSEARMFIYCLSSIQLAHSFNNYTPNPFNSGNQNKYKHNSNSYPDIEYSNFLSNLSTHLEARILLKNTPTNSTLRKPSKI